MKSHLLLGLLSVALLASQAASLSYLDDYTGMTSEQKAAMPSEEDHTARTTLICNSCHWFVVELYGMVHNLTKAHAPKRPKQYVVDDAFEDFCEVVTKKYGLHLDPETKLPKVKYTKLADQLQGGWWGRIFDNECTDFVDKFQMSEKMRNWRNLQKYFDSKEGSITEDTFFTLCPICKKANEESYPKRQEGFMYMNEKTRMIEDWDL